MSMDISAAQARITRELREAEEALDEALIKNSSLFSTVISARRDTGVGAFVGHEALMRLSKSQQMLLDAGGDLARVHGKLSDIQSDIVGYRDCPDGPLRGQQNPPLQATA